MGSEITSWGVKLHHEGEITSWGVKLHCRERNYVMGSEKERNYNMGSEITLWK